MIFPSAGSTYMGYQQLYRYSEDEVTYETQDTHGQRRFTTSCPSKQTYPLPGFDAERYPV